MVVFIGFHALGNFYIVSHFWGDPYLNNTTVLFVTNVLISQATSLCHFVVSDSLQKNG